MKLFQEALLVSSAVLLTAGAVLGTAVAVGLSSWDLL
jgi:hypothetical protein